jgi:hypothetical protein
MYVCTYVRMYVGTYAWMCVKTTEQSHQGRPQKCIFTLKNALGFIETSLTGPSELHRCSRSEQTSLSSSTVLAIIADRHSSCGVTRTLISPVREFTQ